MKPAIAFFAVILLPLSMNALSLVLNTGPVPQDPVFRAGIDMVTLNVAVTDHSGRYVSDLQSTDFTLFDDGRPQPIAYFQPTDVPLGVALLLDTSDSMARCLPLAQAAALGFVRSLGPADLTMVVPFEARVHDLTALTADRPTLEAAIRQTVAKGTTALYDTLYIALKELRSPTPAGGGAAQAPRRKAILVLTDGTDSSSLMGFDDVLDLARRSDVVVYGIGLSPIGPSARLPEMPRFVLSQVTQQTGGRVYFPEDASRLEHIYQEIKTELASQYLVAYKPEHVPHDGRFHQVQIRVARQGVTVRTRSGYVG
jgi:Ca-activated chloride channel family protein